MLDDTTATDTGANGADGGDAAGSPTLPPIRHWPALNLFGVDFDPVLAGLMREGPLTRIQLPNGTGWAWLVTRYDDVRRVAEDPRFGRRPLAGHDVTRLAPHCTPVDGAVVFEDPPHHTGLRRAVAPAFTPGGVERLRERAREVLDELVEGLLRDGPPADFTARLLGPFPPAVACELVGVPARDRPRMHEWTRLVLSSPQRAERGRRAEEEMSAYFADAVRERRGTGGEDVIGLLASAVAAGGITVSEAVGLARLVQVGGEAVTHNTGNMLFVLLTRPDLMDRLRREPHVRPRAVEELLRFIPHRNAVGLSRIALEDLTFGGVQIRAGEAVYVSYLAANRDPDVFPEPERVDFDRSPNPHLAFGHGPHACVGALLARLEAELLVDALADRFPRLRLAVPAEEVRFRRGALIRGPESLPVTW